MASRRKMAWYYTLYFVFYMAVPVQTRVVVGARQCFVLGADRIAPVAGKGILQSEDQVPGS